MPTTVINIGHANNSANASFTLTVTNGVPAGATIVVGARENTTTVALANGTITDSAGNSYTLATSVSNTAGRTGMWFVQNCKAIAAGGTITFTKVGATTDATTMSAGFIEGIGANDAAASGTAVSNVSATTLTTTSGTPAQAGELFVSFIGIGVSSTSVTNDGAWTSPPLDVAASINPSVGGGFRTNAGSGTLTYAPSWATSSTSTAGIIIGFRPFPSGQLFDWSKPTAFRPSVPLVLPVSIALLAAVATSTPRTPVLGPPKKPPAAVGIPSGSPRVLLIPIVSEPRAPVIGPPKPLRLSVPFLQSTPATLLAPAAQNPFIPVDFSVPHDVISTPPQATPYNINLFTNPIPFGPYDYSEGPTSIKFIKPFEPQPNYQNFYPNPIPFGPFDWNKPKQPPPAKEPPTWSLNINLQRNPIPFGPYDWNKAQQPYPSKQFDQQPNYPNFYPNPVPFGPFDWNKPQQPPPAKDQPVWSVNLQLYTNPIPFGPFDWSKQFDVASLPPQALPYNLALLTATVAPPFFNPDYSKPFFPIVRIDQTQPTNVNLFTNPIPFGPFDYNTTHDVVSAPPQASPYNINIFVNPIPTGPFDWSKGAQTLPRTPPPPVERNPLIFSEVPLISLDFSKASAVKAAPQLPAPPYTINLLVPQVAPFVPLDFSKPYFPQIRVDQTQPTNINLYTNPIPVGPFDWSARPGQYPPRAPDQIYPDLVLLQAPPPAPPFIPVDYNKPFFPQIRIDATQPTNINVFTNPIPFGPFDYQISHDVVASPPQAAPYNINLYTNPIPFGPFDWSARSQLLRSSPPQPVERNPLIFSDVPLVALDFSKPAPIKAAPQLPAPPYIIANLAPTAAPFVNIDWSKPFFPQVRIDQTKATNILIFTNPIPLGPYDWSAHPQFLPRLPPQPIERNPLIFSEVPLVPADWSRPSAVRTAPPQPQPYNVLLSMRPFVPVDFSAPKPLPRFAPAAQPYNVALNTPVGPQPFLNVDWSKPFAIRPVVPQGPRNLTLILPPPPPRPGIPFDWSKPWSIRPVPPQPQPNLTLILPPAPVIGIPGLCYSVDFPVASLAEDDVATSAAKADDLAVASLNADDIAAQAAKAEDFAASAFTANASPSGQNYSGPGYMGIYEIDTRIELQGIATDALKNVYADPTSVTLFILDPTGVQTSQVWPSGAIVRESLGHFHFILTPAISGNWTYKWQGSGSVVATSPDTVFTVKSSALIPG